MSTKEERDVARVRLLAVAMCSLRCELARVVQQADDPDRMDEYAHIALAKGETEDGSLLGLSLNDLVSMLGPIVASERLVADGVSWEEVAHIAIESTAKHDVPSEMQRDILLYIEAIGTDRRPSPASTGESTN